MFGRKEARRQKRIDGLIAAGTTIRGDIVFSGGLRIDGTIEGSVSTQNGDAGTVVISEQAQVDAAAAKVKTLIDEEGNPDLKLRVFVSGGGCSGFQYGFTFDEAVNDDDTAMQKNGVTLLIDPMSYQYLVGAEIDYQEGLEGAQFVIKNPNATTTCGCGSSFSV